MGGQKNQRHSNAVFDSYELKGLPVHYHKIQSICFAVNIVFSDGNLLV